MDGAEGELTGSVGLQIDPIDLLGDYLRQNSAKICAEWAMRAPFFVNVDGSLEVVCGRYADIAEVYLNPERFSAEVPALDGYARFNKTMGVKQLAQTEGHPHERLRRLMGPAFSPKSIRVMEEEITRIVDQMLDRIEARAPNFDVMPDFADQLIVHTLLMAMFRLTDEQKQVMLAMNHVLSELSNLRPGQTFPPESLETFEKTKLVIQDLIQKRHDNPGDDFISQLIMAREQDDALTELELFDQVFMVCIAALSTTPSTMGGMLLTLMRHPDQLAVLRADMDRVTDAMDECLRYHTHRFIGGFTRFPVEEVVLGGTVVPKNTPVHLSLQAGHFDPDQFPDPLRFDIDRKPKGLLAFGIGVHNCMGARLARMVLRVALRRFLERFPNVRLADPNLVPVYGGGTGERRIAHMPMRTH